MTPTTHRAARSAFSLSKAVRANGGGSLALEEAGGSIAYGSLSIPSTGGWQNWVTVKQAVQLSAGKRKFGIAIRNGGWTLNWFHVSKAS